MKIGVFLKIFAILANVDFSLKKLSPSPPHKVGKHKVGKHKVGKALVAPQAIIGGN